MYRLKLFLLRLLNSHKIFLRSGDTDQILNLVKKYLPENPYIVEAGSFTGGDTVKISQTWPEGKVFAFEPVADIFKQLEDRTNNLDNVYRFNVALGELDGISNFYNSFSVNKPDKPAAGSLLPPKEHLIYAPHVQFNEVSRVKTLTLDTWAKENNISHIDFLWLDMQGMELSVIKASPNIMKTVKAIYTEVEFIEAYEKQYLYKDIKKYLEDSGFYAVAKNFVEQEAEDVQPNKRWFGDILFIRQ